MALNFWGFRDENEMDPLRFISANPNQGKIDAKQNEEISGKADVEYVDRRDNEIISGVSSAISMVVSAINENTEAINELSAKVEADEAILSGVVTDVQTLFDTKAEKSDLEELSGKVDECCVKVVTDLAELSGTVIDNEHVVAAALNELDGRVQQGEIAQLEDEEVVAAALNELNTKINSIGFDPEQIEDLARKVAENTANIAENTEDISENKQSISSLTQTVSAQTATIQYLYENMAEKSDLEELSGNVLENELVVSAALNELDGRVQQGEIAQLEDEEVVAAALNDLRNEISNIDISGLSGKVITISAETVDLSEELEELKQKEQSDANSLSGAINTLRDTKAEQSYVEAHERYAEETYAKKTEMSAFTEWIDSKADRSDLDKYYTKVETDNLLEPITNGLGQKADYSAMTQYVNTVVGNKADKDDVYTKSEADVLYRDKLIEAKEYTDGEFNKAFSAISENSEKIGVISELKTDKYGNYIDTGNGILDVLHREFHSYTGGTIPMAEGAQIFNKNEVAFGAYNVSSTEKDEEGNEVPSGCTTFSIGIGTSETNRVNAMEARKDGSIYMWIEGDYMNINKILAQIAHEVYDTGSTQNHTGGNTY